MRTFLLLAALLVAVAAAPAADAHVDAGVIVCFEAIPASCIGECVEANPYVSPLLEHVHACAVVTLPL